MGKEKTCPICNKPESQLGFPLMCSNCALDTFGGWTIDANFNMEEWKPAPENFKPPFFEGGLNDRHLATVAIPVTATIFAIEDLRGASKAWSENNRNWFRTEKDERGNTRLTKDKRFYWVMQFSVKPHYLEWFEREMKEHNCFYLVKVENTRQ